MAPNDTPSATKVVDDKQGHCYGNNPKRHFLSVFDDNMKQTRTEAGQYVREYKYENTDAVQNMLSLEMYFKIACLQLYNREPHPPHNNDICSFS